LLAVLFPAAFFGGELLSAADILFAIEPWSEYAPPDFERPNNPLMVDVICAFRPYYAVTQLALDHGEWPLWNPLQHTGVPLLANCQSAVLYPPRLLHAFMDLDVATSVYILLKLWLCGMMAYVCGRGIGFDRWPSRLFSIGWMLCGYNAVWAYWPLPDVSVWLPILFLGVERALRGNYRQGVFVIAIGGTLLLFGGHPETAFTMALGVGGYFVFRLLLDQRSWGEVWRPVAAAAGGWAIALLVTLPLTLPFLEYLLNSATYFERAEGIGEQAPPLNGLAVATFFVPRFFGTTAEDTYWGDLDTNRHFMLYAGVVIWLVVSLVFAAARRDKHLRIRVVSLAIPSVLGAFIAFGTYPIGILNDYPPFSSLIPSYNICFALFSMPLLLGMTAQHFSKYPIQRWQLIGPAVVAVTGIAIIWFAASFQWSLVDMAGLEGYMTAQFITAAGFTIAAVLLIASSVGKRLSGGRMAVLGALVAADLIVAVWGINTTVPGKYVYPATNLVSFLGNLEEPERIGISNAGIPSGIAATFNLEEPYGYDGLYPARIVEFQDTLGRQVWHSMEPVYGMEYYLRNPRIGTLWPEDYADRFEPVTTLDNVQVWRNTLALSRAFVVPESRIVASPDEAYEIMLDPAFDPSQVALIDKPLPQPIDGGTGTARLVERTTTSATIEAQADGSAVLVFSDAYYPGWEARIDGRSTPIFAVYRAFRGIVLPEGKHTVTFEYRPWTFRLGVIVSVVTLVASWLYAAFLVVRTRRTG